MHAITIKSFQLSKKNLSCSLIRYFESLNTRNTYYTFENRTIAGLELNTSSDTPYVHIHVAFA